VPLNKEIKAPLRTR